MKNKLPVYIENKKLPDNPYKTENKESYGFVNTLYLLSFLSIIISLSVAISIFIRYRWSYE